MHPKYPAFPFFTVLPPQMAADSTTAGQGPAFHQAFIKQTCSEIEACQLSAMHTRLTNALHDLWWGPVDDVDQPGVMRPARHTQPLFLTMAIFFLRTCQQREHAFEWSLCRLTG